MNQSGHTFGQADATYNAKTLLCRQSLSSTPSDRSIKTTLAEPSLSKTTDTLTSANLAPVTPDPGSPSPNANDAQHPQQLKPPTKAQLKARAIKEGGTSDQREGGSEGNGEDRRRILTPGGRVG